MSLVEKLREIKERYEATTPGQWVACQGGRIDAKIDGKSVPVLSCYGPNLTQAEANAEWIAQVHADLPKLIAYCEILARAVQTNEDWYEHTEDCQECGKNGQHCAVALSILQDAGNAHRVAVKLLKTGEVPQ